jgi:hypothetical protein
MHNSRDCVVENNIFALGGKFQFDLHGWSKEHVASTRTTIETMIKGYDSVAGQLAWKNMRGMDLHPKDAIREDGTMMSGNVVRRNIMFSDQPGIKYGDLRHVHAEVERHRPKLSPGPHGHPITTGINKVGPDKPGADLCSPKPSTPPSPGKTPERLGLQSSPQQSGACKLVIAEGALRARQCALE